MDFGRMIKILCPKIPKDTKDMNSDELRERGLYIRAYYHDIALSQEDYEAMKQRALRYKFL